MLAAHAYLSEAELDLCRQLERFLLAKIAEKEIYIFSIYEI